MIFATIPLLLKTKQLLYLLYVRPTITYATPALMSKLTLSQLHQLRKIQDSAIRAIYHLPTGINWQYLNNITTIDPLVDHIINLTMKHDNTITDAFLNC